MANTNIWFAILVRATGALLPLIVVTFIYIFKKDFLYKLGEFPIEVIMGAVSIIFGTIKSIPMIVKAPIYSLVLSGGFAVLIFYWVENRKTALISYYVIITIMLSIIAAVEFHPVTLSP